MFEDILEECGRYGDRVGVVIEDLLTGEKMEWNPQLSFSSASLIKYPIMWSFLEYIHEGGTALDEIYLLKEEDKVGESVFDTGVLRELHSGIKLTMEDCLRFMIVISDDTATNIIMKKLGFERMNKAFERLGLTGTRAGRYMMDYEGLEAGRDNFVSAGDMNRLSKIICLNQILPEKYNQMMLDILLGQRENDGVNKCYPMDTLYAHKCGCIRQYGIDHECGILYKEGRPAVTVNICTKNVKESRGFLQRVGQDIYGLIAD